MSTRLYFRLSTTARAVQRRIDAELPERVTVAQAGVLFLIASPTGMLIGDVARGLGAAPSAVTELVDRMVTAGLVERRADPEDGRAQRLFLTEAGQAVRGDAIGRLGEMNALMSDGFDETELATVARWLDAMRDRFTQPVARRAPREDPR